MGRFWTSMYSGEGQDGHEVEAIDAEEAAKAGAEWEDQQGDYPYANGADEIFVTDEGGTETRFCVSVESHPVYYATQILG